ncbi:hypothetical protein E4U42_003002 [Claviceps africana]|uniref:Uncharacterized protein n=1 Tax=Claviceps africana TaxID=83212 RepID=A0A8K0NKX4_9HYPO|nr:hypothetical protein E4U42_003002 [Claviceps africana]
MRLLALLLVVQGAFANTWYCDNQIYGTTCEAEGYDAYCCKPDHSSIFNKPKTAEGPGFRRNGRGTCQALGEILCVDR